MLSYAPFQCLRVHPMFVDLSKTISQGKKGFHLGKGEANWTCTTSGWAKASQLDESGMRYNAFSLQLLSNRRFDGDQVPSSWTLMAKATRSK